MTQVNGAKRLSVRTPSQIHTATARNPAKAAKAATPPADGFDAGAMPGNKNGRSMLDALSQANALLRGSAKSDATQQGAVITGDAANVNDQADLSETNPRHLEAEKQLEANAGLEKVALGRLGIGQRLGHKVLKSGLGADPVAQLALQALLFSGKLTSKASSGDTALTLLGKLSVQRLAKGLDRGVLLSDLVQELACPEAINQRGRGTCVATTVAVYLASSNPAEYVRLVAGLAGPKGTVKTASGKMAAREQGTEVEDGTDRSVSQRLLAPAFMEIANGRFDYDNKDDVHRDGTQEKGSGLSAAQMDVLLEAVFNKSFTFAQNIDKASGREREAAYELIASELKQGELVPVGLIWNEVTTDNGATVTHTGHKVLVTGITQRNGQECVAYINPWGRTEEMPKAEFLDRLRNVNYTPR